MKAARPETTEAMGDVPATTKRAPGECPCAEAKVTKMLLVSSTATPSAIGKGPAKLVPGSFARHWNCERPSSAPGHAASGAQKAATSPDVMAGAISTSSSVLLSAL